MNGITLTALASPLDHLEVPPHLPQLTYSSSLWVLHPISHYPAYAASLLTLSQAFWQTSNQPLFMLDTTLAGPDGMSTMPVDGILTGEADMLLLSLANKILARGE